MVDEKSTREEIIQEYKADVDKLLRYIPWLESKVGVRVVNTYENSDLISGSLTVPVYESTLMSFIKEARNTKLIERNYNYAYSKYRIRNSEDEKHLIANCKLLEIDILKAILSRYIMQGMTKSRVWSEGVENRVFLLVLLKLKELLEFWDKPLA